MSMTGRWIDQLAEQAEQGDVSAQETLRNAGLWETASDFADREFEVISADDPPYFMNAAERSGDECF